MPRARVLVLASGSGTLAQALIDASVDGGLAADVVAVVSDRADAEVLTRATHAGIPSTVVPMTADRSAWDAALTDACASYAPDWVVSAGFMRLLGPTFLERFAQRVVNAHPSLLPAFPGAHAVADALAHGVRVTGCTVHLVDAGLDSGPVIAQEAVPVVDGDDITTLHERIKVVERTLLVRTVARLVHDGLAVEGRHVRFGGRSGHEAGLSTSIGKGQAS